MRTYRTYHVLNERYQHTVAIANNDAEREQLAGDGFMRIPASHAPSYATTARHHQIGMHTVHIAEFFNHLR